MGNLYHAKLNGVNVSQGGSRGTSIHEGHDEDVLVPPTSDGKKFKQI